jgi:hypothetical protein
MGRGAAEVGGDEQRAQELRARQEVQQRGERQHQAERAGDRDGEADPVRRLDDRREHENDPGGESTRAPIFV